MSPLNTTSSIIPKIIFNNVLPLNLRFILPLTEITTRDKNKEVRFGNRAQPMLEADKFTATCQPIV
jgi:hypothetical protein